MRLFRNPVIEAFMSAVSKAMVATGHGYKRDSMRNTGIGNDRRKDKLDDDRPKWLRAYSRRYESVPMVRVRDRRRADRKAASLA